MARIQPIDTTAATGAAKKLLDAVQAKLGITPNMMKTMAQSPAVLDGYIRFDTSLAGGLLDARFREQIAIAVAQANQCGYCLSAHVTLGRLAGLGPDEIRSARLASSADPKRTAGLEFAREVVRSRGQVSGAALQRVRSAGYTDGEIAEIIANVAVNVFTNYFNLVAQTDIDFAPVDATQAA